MTFPERYRAIFHSNHFMKASGGAAAAAFFLKDMVQGALHTACLIAVGVGIFLGTWSTTTRAPIVQPPPGA